MNEMLKLGSIIMQKGVIDEIKEVVLKSLDRELNIGRDRAETVSLTVLLDVTNYLKNRRLV